MKNTHKTEIANSLINASNIVEELGKLKLNNGVTLKEAITIRGISFWTIAEADMALHALPNLLFSKPTFLNYKNKLYLFTRCIKYKFINLIYILFFHFNNLEIKKNKITWFILGFSDYIYRDTLNPIFNFINKDSSEIQPIKVKNILLKNLYINSEKFSLLKKYKNLNIEIYKSKKYLKNNGILELSKRQTIVSNEEFLFIIYWMYNILISKLKFDILITERNLKYYKPEIIISADMADSRSRIYVLLAKKLNIPSLDLQFGAYDESSIEWRFFISEKVAVWGEYFSSIFSNQMKIPSHKIQITGSPRFDYLNTIDKCNQQFKSKTKKIILFASMYTQISSYDARYDTSIIDKFKLDLIDLLKKNSQIELLIKPHPLENLSWIPDLTDFNNIQVIQPSKDIRMYISICDIFVTFGSTSTFDALIQNKTVISANYPGLVWWDDIFLKEKVTLPANNLEELSHYLFNNIDDKIINDISTNKSIFMKKFIDEKIDNSSERIVSLAKSIIYNNFNKC